MPAHQYGNAFFRVTVFILPNAYLFSPVRSHMRQGDKREELIKLHDTHVEVRNIVCHKSCGGHQKSDPDRIIFASAKTLRKMPGQMEIMLVHVDQFRDAIKFATTSANQIADIVDALVAQIDELRSREP